MLSNRKGESPFRESLETRTAGETKSETTGKLVEMRYAYFKALVEGLDAGNLSGIELLYELQQMTGLAAGIFNEEFGTVLAPEERKRLKGTGVSKHGFIDVCFEKAQEMPSLLPSWLALRQFEADREAFEAVQEVFDASQRYDRLVDDTLLTVSDKAYHDALAFYKAVKDAAAAKVPGAEVIFENLSTYFKSQGQHKRDEPAEAEVERDVRSLLHGTKEGRVVVENVKPHTVPGTRRVIDEAGGRLP